ncbi:YafY family transcriptional regulator [Natronospirillum operosum]|uniref:YafY family transcriptional regulator n=1 Tax=Natronospirillum operosum TaxID=2759953 RepID=A0A4Z0W749_9GAMM|nr:YafY family protein [Natronospirillum operosum]TGG93187.1 YafY family transcriptional regulator [Natronospirillum operosum]
MKAERLVNIMILLQNCGKMTSQQLADHLQVSQRTILRDMDALSVSGIPVVAERGKAGGWRLMDHFRSQLSGINLEDMKALFIPASAKMLQDLGVAPQRVDIRQKLLSVVPEHVRGVAGQYMEKLYIDTETWKPSAEKNAALQIVQQALWEDRKLNMTYEKVNGDRSQRTVCPLGLVAKGSAWYLTAVNEQGEFRNFRVSRIVQAELLAERFTRPESFSLADHWQQSKLAFADALPTFQVEVSVPPDVLRRMTFANQFVTRIHSETSADQKEVRVTLNFHTEQDAVSYILGFGGQVRLLSPQQLIPDIVQQAKQVIELYSNPKG